MDRVGNQAIARPARVDHHRAVPEVRKVKAVVDPGDPVARVAVVPRRNR